MDLYQGCSSNDPGVKNGPALGHMFYIGNIYREDMTSSKQGWEENSTLVFTGGIYGSFLAWRIRLKWQILANNGKYNFLSRNAGKYDF